jgi:hypothetical protein
MEHKVDMISNSSREDIYFVQVILPIIETRFILVSICYDYLLLPAHKLTWLLNGYTILRI